MSKNEVLISNFHSIFFSERVTTSVASWCTQLLRPQTSHNIQSISGSHQLYFQNIPDFNNFLLSLQSPNPFFSPGQSQQPFNFLSLAPTQSWHLVSCFTQQPLGGFWNISLITSFSVLKPYNGFPPNLGQISKFSLHSKRVNKKKPK